ncbi:MAG: phosphopantetheine-binding protein [Thermodesulfobacteriota bacterium]|jgi:acyl carrier protein|nr:MAG: phosphopantetheine-binding protein [Thermodesulfobacteriota bacterium]
MSEKREQRRQGLVRFLRDIQKAGLPVDRLGDTDELIASGLIDSLAILEIVLYLEQTYGIDFSVLGIDRDEFSTIGNILDLIERQKPEVN